MNIQLNDSTVWALKRALPKAVASLSADIQNLAREIDATPLKERERRDARIKHHNVLTQEQDDLMNLLDIL